MTDTLQARLAAAAEHHPERPAITLGDARIDYQTLVTRARRIAKTLAGRRSPGATPLTAVLGSRTVGGFEGIVGALWSGHGYVPMLPSYPASRLAWMIERAQTAELVVDEGGIKLLPAIAAAVQTPLTIILAGGSLDASVVRDHPRHTFVGRDELVPDDPTLAPAGDAESIAYLLFTSGSTGEPKGVMVAQRNITRFLDVVTERYAITAEDRLSHVFEVTFDLSVFDLFASWTNGACLCVPDAKQRMLPAAYIEDTELSIWFSVPSTALLMKETRTLTPGAFGKLRASLFCGEALTMPVAQAWAQAAPNSVVDNLYGPTELTLACTEYRLGADSTTDADSDVVPIGAPLPGMRAKVVDESLEEVAPGQSGELIMAGPQVALGYWRDAERTAAAFVVPPGETATFYRTGDRVRRPEGDGPLLFLGRMDHQVKIRGFRVELGEVEAAVRDEAGVDAAIALGWPVSSPGCADGIVAFIDDASVDTKALKRRLLQRVPRYLVPKRFVVIDSFPLNANGKIDRKALLATLQST